MAYGKLLNPNVPQTKQARPDQVPNNAGGYGFSLDKWQQLNRYAL